MLGFDLGHLATGEVKNLLAEQFEDDHVVLTEALAGPTRAHDITDEGGPVFGPFLLQDLNQSREDDVCHHIMSAVSEINTHKAPNAGTFSVSGVHLRELSATRQVNVFTKMVNVFQSSFW